jgi:hypothetical protein
MSAWCQCGNAGPNPNRFEVGLGYCQMCWLEKYHPDKLPPLAGIAPKQAQPNPPGIIRKAINFGKAVAQHVAAGLKLVTKEEAERRKAICGVCPKILPGDRCRLCGCHLSVKRTWAEQKCPDTPPKW